MSFTVETEFGRFRRVSGPDADDLADGWVFECPGCGVWAYLDDDQWHGRVSVDHAADGCPGGYHETHDYAQALALTIFKDHYDAKTQEALSRAIHEVE